MFLFCGFSLSLFSSSTLFISSSYSWLFSVNPVSIDILLFLFFWATLLSRLLFLSRLPIQPQESQVAVTQFSLVIASKAKTSIINTKLGGLSAGAINAPRINIANIKLGANGANVIANTFAIAVADSKVENNIASIENALIISIASNCLKEVERTNTWKFSRLGSVEIEKADSWVVIRVTMPICKD